MYENPAIYYICTMYENPGKATPPLPPTVDAHASVLTCDNLYVSLNIHMDKNAENFFNVFTFNPSF